MINKKGAVSPHYLGDFFWFLRKNYEWYGFEKSLRKCLIALFCNEKEQG